MARKKDIKDVEKIAQQFDMDSEQRRDFGDYLEECKNAGGVGTRNDRGDFTWSELEDKAREFLEEESDD